jgi:cell division protein ZapA (FtsZ GTPase activity inhibitor)
MASDDSDKKQVRVTIFNQAFSLRTSGDEREAEELAHSVDELMNSIARRSGNLDAARVAILASLHLADQLRTLEGDLEQLQERVKRKSQDFSIRLDRALGSE